MSSCQDFEKRLPAYQEGLVSGQDKKDLEDHLRSCAICRLALQDLNRTKDLLGRLQEIDPPPWFTQKVMARVREEAEGKRGLLRKLFYPLHIKIPLEAMASILVVVLAVYVFKTTEPEMPLLRAPSESVSPIPKDFAYRDKGKGVASVPASPTSPITPQNLETKTATGGRLEKDQDPHQLSGSGALRDNKMEEKRPLAARSPEQPATEIPKELFANKMEEPGSPVAPMKKMESAESKPAPAQAPKAAMKEKDREKPEDLESREAKGKSASDRSTVGQTAVYKSAPIGITLQVLDVREAGQKALDLLQHLGAKNVHRETNREMEIITAAVTSPAIPNLLDQLNTLGTVQRKGPLPPTPEGPVSIRIEISRFIP
jgi:hypothetical protein